jgi:DNA helicase-2/ATP-dependent DNA helicase PcrA
MSGFTPSPEQRAILDHPLDVPLRVAAGAGTGKTTTIALRLAVAVESGEVAPEEALGLTFTNKAADELADRLHVLLPEQTVEGRYVEVSTYHGFAWSILSEFGAYAGVERESRIIGPGFVRQLVLESLQTATELDHVDLTSLPHRTSDVARLASGLTSSLVTPDALEAAAPPEPDDVWAKRLELLRLVRSYRLRKRELGVVDYSDLITTALDIVTRHTHVTARIRNRYRIVLLDEYQDTDAGQRKLLQAVFGEGFPVTAVGDVDQTIYEWRGASPANFDAFPHHFPDEAGDEATTLPLSLNRRSGTRILELANAIRTEIHGDPPADPLRATPEAPAGSLRLAYHNDARTEALGIAEEIVRLHGEEGVPWSSMAVLFRTNGRIPVVRAALEQLDVPHEVASLGGLLSVPDVADLHAWLTVLADPEASASLARLLLGPRYRLGIGDLAPLARWAKDRGRLTDEVELAWPLLEAIDRLDDVDGVGHGAATRLRAFRAEYGMLLAAAQSLSLVELCRRILDTTDTWTEIDGRQPAAALSARLNLFRFLDLAEEWSPLEGRPSLGAFLGYLDTLEDEASSDELDTASAGSAEAVSLLTVHRAKGLEWDTVFLPGLTRPGFPTRSRGFDDPFRAPTSVPYELRADAAYLPHLSGAKEDRDVLRHRHMVQELRTAYVAVTRARNRLYLSGSHHWGQKTAQPPSIIFELGRAVDGAVLDVFEEPGEAPASVVLVAADPAPDPVFPDGWLEAMRAVAGADRTTRGAIVRSLREHVGVTEASYDAAMEQFRFELAGLPDPPERADEQKLTSVSVTGLVTMAQCARRYFWSEIDRLPRRPTSASRRGTEVHRRIELHHRGQIPLDDLADVDYDFTPLEGGAGESAAGAVSDAMATFHASEYAERRPLFVETPIDISLPSGRARGRIDAVYATDDGWEIVDFKSGRRHDDPARHVQLDAYAVAATDGALGPAPDRLDLSFVFLGGGELTVDTVHATPAHVAAARERLDGLLRQIAAGGTDRTAFPVTAGPHCRGCDFLPHCDAGQRHVAGT